MRDLTRSATAGAVLLACLALLLGGCSRDSDDWKAAQAANTPEAYDAFLRKYPQSAYAGPALQRGKEIAEQRDWELATQLDTADSYREFLVRHGEGKWASEARVRIENFSLADATALPPVGPSGAEPVAPAAAVRAAPPAAAKAKAKAATVAGTASVAASSLSRTGNARIQLGAFSTAARARTEWLRLQARFQSLAPLSSDISAVKVSAGQLFRLQAGVRSTEQAREICATLRTSGQACIVVGSKAAESKTAGSK